MSLSSLVVMEKMGEGCFLTHVIYHAVSNYFATLPNNLFYLVQKPIPHGFGYRCMCASFIPFYILRISYCTFAPKSQTPTHLYVVGFVL